MALDINRMNYNVLYKTLDEKESYFTTGTTYVTRVLNMQKNSTIKNPIISVYHFTSDERIDYVVYGELINHSSQSGVEYSILGWKIDKDSNMNEIGLKETAKEIVCSWSSLTPVESLKSELLKIEISSFFDNPIEYFKRNESKEERIIVDELNIIPSEVCVIFKDAEEERLFSQIAQDINYGTHSELQEKANVLCKRKKYRRSK